MSIDFGKLGAVAGVVSVIVGVVALGVSLLLASGQPRRGLARAITILSCVTVVAVVLVTAIVYVCLPGSSGASTSDDTSTNKPDTPPTTPSSAPGSGVPPAPDPPPPPLPHDGMAALQVSAVCLCDGPGEQGRVSLILSMQNISDVPISAFVGNIRLLVPGAMPGDWRPVNPTAPLTSVTIDPGTFLAFPANGNGAPGSDGDESQSHWYGDVLAPGEIYPPNGGEEVTFYVPDPGGQTPVFGVALVTNDGLIAMGWLDTGRWPQPAGSHR